MSGTAQRLADTENWTLLQATQQSLAGRDVTPRVLQEIGKSLREQGVESAIAAAITSQLQLRSQAEAKFGDSAQHMLLTRDGMEQATRFPLSFLHALRFKEAGVAKVADLGCGIGSDAVALAEVGVEVLALDRDPEATACAATNLRTYPKATVLLGDIADVTPAWLAASSVSGIFLDPARRAAGKRVLQPENWSPPWIRVREIFSWGCPTGAKLAPGIDHSLLTFGSHAQWASFDGELVEASLWSEQLSPEGPGRSALAFRRGAPSVLRDPETRTADAPVRAAPAGPVSKYVYEPDGAAIRAGALAYLAELTGTHLLHPRIAYMTGEAPVWSPFLRGFKIEAVVPLRQKRVLHTLQELGGGRVEVKKRGAKIDTSTWQRELQKKLTGGRPLAVLATQTDNGHAAIVASRLPAEEPEG